MDYNWLYTHFAFLKMYFNQIILQISWRSTPLDEVLVSKFEYNDGNKESIWPFISEYLGYKFKKVGHLFKNADSLWYYM